MAARGKRRREREKSTEHNLDLLKGAFGANAEPGLTKKTVVNKPVKRVITETTPEGRPYQRVVTTTEPVEVSSFGQGYYDALQQQENERRERWHASINGMNAITSVASLVYPQSSLLQATNFGLGIAGVLQDIEDGNYIQTAAGLTGLAAPILGNYNFTIKGVPVPKITTRTTKAGVAIPNGVNIGHVDIPIMGGAAAHTVGLAGDSYGYIVDDNGKLIYKEEAPVSQ